jgi:branched-chain amino acid transport system permease protein
VNTILQYGIDAISSAALYGLLALGLAMTFGVARIVNLAFSELVMVGSYLILAIEPAAWPLVIFVVLVGVVLLALLMERAVFRPLRGADATTLLVASFGISLLLENVVTAFEGTNARSVNFGAALVAPTHIGSLSIAKLDLVTIAVTGSLLLALTVFFRRSSVGVQLRAAAADFEMAEMLGVRSTRMIVYAFAISGVTAAVAALLLTAQTGTLTPTLGVQPVLVAVVATVIGGLGNLPGAVVGGLLMGAAGTVLSVTLPAGLVPYQGGVLYVLVIVVLLARPHGLFTRASSLERI